MVKKIKCNLYAIIFVLFFIIQKSCFADKLTNFDSEKISIGYIVDGKKTGSLFKLNADSYLRLKHTESKFYFRTSFYILKQLNGIIVKFFPDTYDYTLYQIDRCKNDEIIAGIIQQRNSSSTSQKQVTFNATFQQDKLQKLSLTGRHILDRELNDLIKEDQPDAKVVDIKTIYLK